MHERSARADAPAPVLRRAHQVAQLQRHFSEGSTGSARHVLCFNRFAMRSIACFTLSATILCGCGHTAPAALLPRGDEADPLAAAVERVRNGKAVETLSLPAAPGCDAQLFARVSWFDVGGMGLGEMGTVLELSRAPFPSDAVPKFDYGEADGGEHILVNAEDETPALVLTSEPYVRSSASCELMDCEAPSGSVSCELVYANPCTGRVLRRCGERDVESTLSFQPE